LIKEIQSLKLICSYFQFCWCQQRNAADCRTGKRREKNKKKTGKKNVQGKQSTLRSVSYTSETWYVCRMSHVAMLILRVQTHIPTSSVPKCSRMPRVIECVSLF